MTKREPKITWGLRDGDLVHIDSLCPINENGLSCRCFCIECGKPLVAKNSWDNERAPHFSHKAFTSVCAGGAGGMGAGGGFGESVFHIAAKRAVKELGQCPLPKVDSTQLFSALNLDHADTRLVIREAVNEEQYRDKSSQKDYYCDVSGYTGHYRVVVEVTYSSKTTYEKFEFLKSRGVEVLELSLNKYWLPKEEDFKKALKEEDWEWVLGALEKAATTNLPSKWSTHLILSTKATRLSELEAEFRKQKTELERVNKALSNLEYELETIEKERLSSKELINLDLPELTIVNPIHRDVWHKASEKQGKLYLIQKNLFFDTVKVVNLACYKTYSIGSFWEPTYVTSSKKEAERFVSSESSSFHQLYEIHNHVLVIFDEPSGFFGLVQIKTKDESENAFSNDWNSKLEELVAADERGTAVFRLSSRFDGEVYHWSLDYEGVNSELLITTQHYSQCIGQLLVER